MVISEIELLEILSKELPEIQKDVDQLILAMPMGPERVLLADINIKLHGLIDKIPKVVD